MKLQELLNEAADFTEEEFGQIEEALIYWIRDGLPNDDFYGEEDAHYEAIAKEALALVRRGQGDFNTDQAGQVEEALLAWVNKGVYEDDWYGDNEEDANQALTIAGLALVKVRDSARKYRRITVGQKRQRER